MSEIGAELSAQNLKTQRTQRKAAELAEKDDGAPGSLALCANVGALYFSKSHFAGVGGGPKLAARTGANLGQRGC